MRRPELRHALAAAVAMSVLAAARPGLACETGVTWSALELRARKGIFGARVELSVGAEPAASAAARLASCGDPDALQPSGDCVVVLTSRTDPRPGHATETLAVLDPARGLLGLDTERHRRVVVRRYLASGTREWRTEDGERRERLVEWPEPAPDGVPVVDVTSLLYLASLHRLDEPDARLEVRVPSKGRLISVTCVATDVESVEEIGGGTRPARRVLLSASDPADAERVELMGMNGAIELMLEVGTGVPLEVRGAVRKLGKVRVRLVERTPA